MIDVAYLRVYQPAAKVRLPVAEAGGRRPRLTDVIVLSESQTADAWEVEWRGRTWRCPRAPRRRMLESLVAFHKATSRFGVGIIDSGVAEAARRELSHIRSGMAEPAAVLVSAWHPPLRWFVLFTPTDQVEAMLLRTSMLEAVGRIAETVEAMRKAGLPEMWVEDLAGLESWLRAFPSSSMVELDFRQVGWRHDSGAGDETVVDVARAVQLMIEGELEASVETYGLAMMRWAGAQAIGYSS